MADDRRQVNAMTSHVPNLQDVRRYWERNPVAANAIPHVLGTPEYFDYYDALREANEPPAFSARLHEYAAFAGRRVLDIGSGNGYVLSRYASAGAQVCGVDLTNAAVGLCRKRFALMKLPGVFTVGNAECLPFEDETFDCVCSMGVLHHTPDTTRAVGEVFRVLRPGGRVILMFYHRNSLQYRVKFPLMRWIRGKSLQQSINEVDGVGNPKGDVYSRRELARLMAQFTNLEMFAGVLPWHFVPRLETVVPAGVRERLERRWGWFLYVKGVRP
jgi:SAM-dependent methyltransferase